MKRIIPVFIAFFFVSCETTPNEEAEVTESKGVAPIPEEEPIIQYDIRASASEVSWIGSKPTGKHNGRIGIESGQITVLDGEIVGGKVVFDMNDVEVYDLRSDEDSQMKLTEHLRSEDFFHVEKYPHATFEITAVQKYDTINKDDKVEYKTKNKPLTLDTKELKNPTHFITGNLTIKDKTLSVKFPSYILLNEDQLVTKASFIIDRTLWNIKHKEEAEFLDKAKDNMIFNDVNIGLDIIANPDKEII